MWLFDDGTEILIRPIRPEDEPLMVRLHSTLSERTRICFIDYDREMVLVAERQNPETAEREILAVGRLNKAPDANEAEFVCASGKVGSCDGRDPGRR